MKQEPGRQQPGISGLQAGEDVKFGNGEAILCPTYYLEDAV